MPCLSRGNDRQTCEEHRDSPDVQQRIEKGLPSPCRISPRSFIGKVAKGSWQDAEKIRQLPPLHNC